MFEYSYNPSEAMMDKKFIFSYDNLMKIADISNNIWDDSDDIYAFLESYDNPFYHIWHTKHVIRIEIHANLFTIDKKWVEERFKETVNKAVRLMLESNFNKYGR